MQLYQRIKARFTENSCAANSSGLYVSNKQQGKKGTALLLIDPQVDFVTGSLAIEGAIEDCNKTAEFIRVNGKDLDNIYVTLDTHQKYHISHPAFWKKRGSNEQPEAFHEITFEDVKNGTWLPVDDAMYKWALYYTKKLEQQKRKGITGLKIWPEHCRIGTNGHSVYKVVEDALTEWEEANNKSVHYVIKGNNSKTEHFSAFKAEVGVKADPRTYFNKKLYKELRGHNKIIVAGQAKSHCVNFTVRDLVNKMGDKKAARTVVLAKDGMTSVPKYEHLGDEFTDDMEKKGIKATPFEDISCTSNNNEEELIVVNATL